MSSGVHVTAGALIGFSTLATIQASPNWAWGIAAGICMALIGVAVDINEG